MTRAGFVALAGRPNVGKSALTNAIVGAKVAMVSDRPQTTRRAIRGVATGPDWQLVLIDLPGVHQRLRLALLAQAVDLVDRDGHRAGGVRERGGDIAVAGADRLLTVEQHQCCVGVGQLQSHAACHSLG